MTDRQHSTSTPSRSRGCDRAHADLEFARQRFNASLGHPGDTWHPALAEQADRRLIARGHGPHLDLVGLFGWADADGWVTVRRDELNWVCARRLSVTRLRKLAAEPGSGISEVRTLPDPASGDDPWSRPFVAVRVELPAGEDIPLGEAALVPAPPATEHRPPVARRKTHTAQTWDRPGGRDDAVARVLA